MGIETIIAVVGVVASVASTAYSVVSSEQAEAEATHERRQARRAAGAKEIATQDAAKAESERIQKRRGFMSTVKTGMGGITEEPTALKTTLGG